MYVCKAMRQGCKVLFVTMTDKFYPKGFRRSDVSEGGGGMRERFDLRASNSLLPWGSTDFPLILKICNNKTPYPVPCSS